MSDGIWERIRRGFANAFSMPFTPGAVATGGGPSNAGPRVNAGSALSLSTVWACLRLTAGTMSSLPIELKVEKSPGDWQEKRDHPLFDILKYSPNADQTALDFWQFLNVSLELWGNAYAVKNRVAGRVIGLTPVRPEAVSVRRNSRGALEYSYPDGSQTRTIGQDDMLHVRGFGGDPLGGMSTLSFGRQSFGLGLATERAAADVYRNGLRPSGVVTQKDGTFLKPDQRRDMYDNVLDRFGGENNGRPILLEGGYSWTSLTISAVDAQMIQSRQFSVEDCCRWFGIPPHLIGHTAGNTQLGSSIEQQTLAYLIFALRERMKRVEQSIAKQLLTPIERQKINVGINFEGLLRADSAGRAAFYQSMVANGIMTRNEVRRIEGLPPLPGGDVLTIQSNMIPADKLGLITTTTDAEAAKNAFMNWLGHNGGPKLES